MNEAKRKGGKGGGKSIEGGNVAGKDERETENPKVWGCAAKSLLRIVDFPEPEGPEMTMGRWRRGTKASEGERVN